MAHEWPRHVDAAGATSYERVCAGAELELAVNRARRLSSDIIAACVVTGSSLAATDLRERLVAGLLSARSRWPTLGGTIVWHRSDEDDSMPHLRYEVPTADTARSWAEQTLAVHSPSASDATGETALWICQHRDMANAACVNLYAQHLVSGAIELTCVLNPCSLLIGPGSARITPCSTDAVL